MNKIGECTVGSKVWWGPTGINLTQGTPYQIEASGQWHDASICCGAGGYDLSVLSPWKRLMFRWAGRFRPLDTDDRWFMLLGRVGKDGSVFEIGANLDLRAPASGQLYCTVNDIKAMYFNNEGAVQVQVYDSD